jgi:uncharacterized protein YchJ
LLLLLKEKSTFLKYNGKWLYADAEVSGNVKNIRGDVIKPQGRAIKTLQKGVPKGNQG